MSPYVSALQVMKNGGTFLKAHGHIPVWWTWGPIVATVIWWARPRPVKITRITQ